VFAKQLGVLYEFDNKCFTDGAANETGADLFFEITGADSDSVTFTFSGTVPVSPRETSCTVINKDTLAIHRSQYSISGTTTKTATLLTPFSSIPPVGSVITFDLPVLQWDSRVFNGNAPFDQKRYLFTHARIAANGDNKSFVGVKINNSTTCAKAWHLNFSGLGHFDPNQTPPSVAGAEYGFKGRVAKVGEEAQLRFIGYYPRCEWFLSTLALRYTNHYARI
jgi:hypothetical protein